MATGFEDKDRDLHLYVRDVRDAKANYDIALSTYLDGTLQDNLDLEDQRAYYIAEKELKRALLNLEDFVLARETARRMHLEFD